MTDDQLPTICSRCGAAEEGSGDYCIKCGARLRGGIAPPPSADDSFAAKFAARELKHAERAISIVRTIFFSGVALYAYNTNAVLQTFRGRPITGGWRILLVYSVASTLLMGVGGLRVRKEPFFWSIVLVGVALVNVIGGFLVDILPVIPFLVLLGAWGAVVQASRMRKLLAKYPELGVSRRLRAMQGAPERGSRRPRR